jgi:hypothetical protein
MLGTHINPLKSKLVWIIFNNSIPTAKETMHFHYEDQLVNSVWGNSHCLLWDSYETHKHNMWENVELLIIKAGVHTVTTGLPYPCPQCRCFFLFLPLSSTIQRNSYISVHEMSNGITENNETWTLCLSNPSVRPSIHPYGSLFLPSLVPICDSNVPSQISSRQYLIEILCIIWALWALWQNLMNLDVLHFQYTSTTARLTL